MTFRYNAELSCGDLVFARESAEDLFRWILCRPNTRSRVDLALPAAGLAGGGLAYRVLLKIIYLLMRCLLALAVVAFRGDQARNAELLVLRHENAVPRRHAGRVRYQPPDRVWLAPLARLIPRRSPRGNPTEPYRVHGRLLVGAMTWFTAQISADRSCKAKVICPVPQATSRRRPLPSASVRSARSSIRLRGYGPLRRS